VEGYRRGQFQVPSGIWLEETTLPTQHKQQKHWSPAKDLNLRYGEYEALGQTTCQDAWLIQANTQCI
jgi:hypothetical protein